MVPHWPFPGRSKQCPCVFGATAPKSLSMSDMRLAARGSGSLPKEVAILSAENDRLSTRLLARRRSSVSRSLRQWLGLEHAREPDGQQDLLSGMTIGGLDGAMHRHGQGCASFARSASREANNALQGNAKLVARMRARPSSYRLLTQPNPAQDRHESWKAQYPAGGRRPPAPSHGQTGCQSKGTSRGKPESAEEEDPGPRLRGRVRRIKCHWREDRPRQGEEGARGAESK